MKSFRFLGYISLLVNINLNLIEAQVSGIVFRDFNGDGLKQTDEPLVLGVIVNVYDASNTLCATAVSSGATAPNYSAAGCGTGPVRVEFILPTSGACASSGIDFSAVSGAVYGSSVQFVNGNSTNVNYAIHYNGHYNLGASATNMFIPCYVNGNPLGGGSSGTNDWFVGFPYLSSGSTPPPLKVNGTQLGATWGTAYSRQAGVIFTSAFIKRHVGLGPLGSGGIYKLTPSGSTFTVSPFYDLDANGFRTRAGAGAPAYGNGSSFQISGPNNNLITYLGPIDPVSGAPEGLGVVGVNGAGGRNLPASATLPNYDPAAFGQVGKVGLGGMDISPDGRFLYVMNLYDRKLYRLEVNDPFNPTSVVAVSSYALPAGITCTNGVLRPFAVRFYRGKVYVGAVCSGENGGSNTVGGPTDLYAYVFELNNATSGSASFNATPVISFPLNYQKGHARADMSPPYRGSQWYPWVNNTDAVLIDPGDPGYGTYPSPMLTDLDFTDRGDLVMAFTDRGGHVWGTQNYQRLAVSTQFIQYIVGGDVLIAGINCSTGTFTLESNGSFVSSGTTFSSSGGVANNQGPGGGEFFHREEFNNNNPHQETAQGSVSTLFGQGQVMSTVMDPTAFFTGGTRRFSTSNGSLISASSYQLYGNFPAFGKANGLGDLSWGAPAAPIEVGNRVWSDLNGNGRQDANEPGLANVPVELYKETSPGVFTLIASAVTDANGNYYFSSRPGTSTASAIYGVSQLLPNMSYELRFPTSVGGANLTIQNNGGSDPNADERDSDANAGGAIAFVTGGPGATSHSFDVGYFSCIPPSNVTLNIMPATCSGSTPNNNGTVVLTGVTNGTHVGVSTLNAATYDGPTTTALATPIGTLPQTIITGVPNTGGTYIVRIFNTVNGCFVDQTVTVAPNLCCGLVISYATACQPSNNGSYDLTVTLTYVNSPGGTINVSLSTGQTQTSASTAPGSNGTLTVVFTGLVNTGATGIGISAAFTANPSCSASAFYDAPASCCPPPYPLCPGESYTLTAQGGFTNYQWYFNGNPIPGATSQTYVASVVGSYTWTANNAGCPIGSCCPIVLAPGTNCCSITAINATVNCNNNNTGNPTDDFYSITVNPTGNGTGSQYNVVIVHNSNTYTFGPFNYGSPSPALGSFLISQGNATVTVNDVSNSGCSLGPVPVLAPPPCSTPMSIGSLVWLDDQPGLNATDNNGMRDPGEPGLPNVVVRLYNVGSDGIKGSPDDFEVNVGPDGLLGTSDDAPGGVLTNASGHYFFGYLNPGSYYVLLSASNFAPGGPAAAYQIVSTVVNPNDDQMDDDNNGIQMGGPGGVVMSPIIVLFPGTEPNGEPGAGGNQDLPYDNNGDMTVDFALVPMVTLGSTVFRDDQPGLNATDNNGVQDAGEPGIPGVLVELWSVGPDGVLGTPDDVKIPVGPDGILGTADDGFGDHVTNASGNYFFSGIPEGTYYVVIPASQFAPGGPLAGTPLASAVVNTAPNGDVDSDNNAIQTGGAGNAVRSNPITLIAGTEPVGGGEPGQGGTQDDAHPYTDANGNMTLDFGFVPAVSVGSVVFGDNNDNGIYEPLAGENGISGVTLRLYSLGPNGIKEDGGGDDVLIATTVTDPNGIYFFGGLYEGQYYILIDNTQFSSGNPLHQLMSSTDIGTTGTDNTTDGDDNGIASGTINTPSYYVTSPIFTLIAGMEPTGVVEAGPSGTQDDAHPHFDANGDMTKDFGFVTTLVAIGNFVFMDNNENNVYDPTDMPIANVLVWLYPVGANYGIDPPLATDLTDPSGYYYFNNLLPGQYVIYIPASNFGPGGALQFKESVPGQDLTTTVDDNDNGNDTPVNGGIISNVVNLQPGAQPQNEGGAGGDGSATPAYPGTLPDASVNETIDFGFRLQRVALGNFVFMDNNDNGVFDGGDMGIPNVVVWLYPAGANYGVDAPLATTTTDASGYYYFDNLVPGQYVVFIPASNFAPGGPLDNKETVPGVDGGQVADGNDNGQDVPVNGGIVSNVINLQPGVQPTGENQVNYPGTLPDANVNATVDFGFRFERVAVGNFVFMDNNSNGVFDAGDMGIPGVVVWLYPAGADYGVNTPLAVTTTNAAGYYYFDNLAPGQYVVYIPASNFGAGQPLAGKQTTPGQDTGDATDNNDNGNDTPDDGGIVSNVFTLTPGAEPVGEDQTDYPGSLPDDNVNATIDFAFRQSGVAVGNFVFMDNNENNVYDAGDMPIANVVVWLYAAGANYGVDAPLAVDVTDASGYYYFDNLTPGQYVVYIPPVNFGAGGALQFKESVPGQDTGDALDNNDNGNDTPDDGGIVSNVFTLTPYGEPVNELGAGGSGTGTPAYPGILPDASVNETIDFGFRLQRVALGNFVFMDNNDNGVFDGGDMGIPNVVVWLYPAGANYGVDAPLATTTTDASGYYYFDNLVPGQYVVFIPASNFAPGGPLDNKETVPGVDGGQVADGNDNGQDVPVNGGIVSNVINLQPGVQPTGENQVNYPGTLPDANVNATVDFGFRFERVAVGNFVFMDNNSNGVFDAGDMGIPGVVVWLYPAGADYGVNTPLAVTTTNAAGYYYFDNLAPGQYVVYIPASNFGAGQPLAGKQTTPGQDTGDATDNNDNGNDTPDDGGIVSNVFTLTPGGEPTGENQTDYPGTLPDDNVNATIDFAFRQSGVAVGNFVFMDNNENNVYDAGDMPIANVVVWLYAAGANYGVDAPLAVDVTDASGYYYFDNLTPGQYVVYIPPVNFGAGGALQFKESVPGQDTGDALDNNDNGNDTPDDGGIVSNVFTLTPYGEPVNELGAGGSGTGTPAYPGILPDASVNETIDFGFRLQRVALGNFVYLDKAANGVFDGSDTPIPGVTVQLYKAGANYGVDAPLATTVTNAGGYYYFDNLVPGDYVVFIPASNFAPGQPLHNKLNTAGADGGQVIDNNDNGIDTPIAGGIASNVISLQPGVQPTGENQVNYPGTLPDANVNATVDFGFFTPAKVGDFVWHDLNGNGIQDSGEPGIPNVVVILQGTDNQGNIINLTTTTDGTGMYMFGDLPPGTYTITFVTPTGGYVPTAPNQGSNDGVDSDADPSFGGSTPPFTLNSGDTIPTFDAGYYIPAAIGNYVWYDADADGIQDPTETGIPGVTVILTGTDGLGNPITLTTTTDGNGYYLFDSLPPGTYKLTFITPPGFDFLSPLDQGTNDALDSDADPNNGNMTIFETLTSGEVNLTYDAGFYICPEIAIKNLPVQPLCPLEEVAGIQIFTMPAATTISWAGGASIGLNDGSGPGPMAEIPAFITTAEDTVTITVTAILGQCTTTTTFTLMVADDRAPIYANCPPDITVDNYPGECGARPTWDEPVVQDDCASYANTLTLTQVAGLPSGSFLPVSATPYTIRYVADDGNGNTSVCEFTILVQDKEAPKITCPPDITVLTSSNGTGDCAGIVPELRPDAVVTDNCPGPWTLVQTPSAGSTITGVHGQQFDITITVTDNSGNTASCVVEATLVDNEAPVLTVTPLNASYECLDQVPAAPVQIPTDNCSIAATDFSESTEAGPCPNQAVITRRWVVYDHAGNSSEHIQTIRVNDNRPPVFVVTPVDRTYECLNDVPPAPDQGEIATDNCGVVFVDFFETRSNDSCDNKVVIIRRWEATDLCGNKATHWQYITVRDTIKPTFRTTPVDRTYACTEDVPAAPIQIARDNCQIVYVDFAETVEPGGCLNKYVITRRWYAYDQCGNTAEHWQTITVNDSIAPVWTSPLPADVTVQCGEDVQPATLTASDNCSAKVLIEMNETLLPGAGPNDNAVLERRWTACDACGNKIQHIQRVTINDVTPPVLGNLPPATVNAACAEDVPAVANVTVSDNCQGTIDFDFSETILPGNCDHRFTLVRTWRATDFAGNSTQFVQTINVNDNVAPTWTSALPADVTVQCGEQVPPAVVTASDNCSGAVLIESNETLLPGAGPNDGTVLVRRWTAYDVCGNSTQHMQRVTINDVTPPVLGNLPPATVNAACAEDVPAVANVTVSDNCQGTIDFDFSETILPGNCDHRFTLVRTWRATDFAGNSTQFVQTINVNDNVPPTWTSALPADVTVQCGEQVPAAVVTASDNCSGAVLIESNETLLPGAGPNDGTVLVRRWTAYDVCGNSTQHMQRVTINDVTPPVLGNLPPATVNAACAEEVPAVANVTVSDNCQGTIDFDFSETILPGNCDHRFTLVRTWRATDFAGNSTQFVQTINVNDNVPPTWTSALPADVTVQCGEQVPAAVVTASDNCSGAVLIESNETLLPGAGPNDGTVLVRRWTAYDVCGNSTQHMQRVTINDVTPPVLGNLPPATVNAACAEEVPAVANVTVSDNCQGTIDFDFSETILPGNCDHRFTLVRTWRATDFAGNSTQFVQTINVNDNVPPTWTSALPADVTVQCGEQVPAAVVTASDNCSGAVLIESNETLLPGAGPNDGTVLVRRWTAYDVCGNSTQHMQRVTINDVTPPVLGNLPPATVNAACAEEVPAVANVTVSDNCQGTIDFDFSETILPGNCDHRFTLVRTWRATDFAGNSTQFVQTINVNDNVPPTWTSALPTDVTVQCGEQVPPAVVTASDNCSGAVLIESNETLLPGAGPNDGTVLVRRWTAYDVCGNSTQHMQRVTINDVTPPVLGNLPPATVNAACAEDVPAVANVTVSDNCQGTIDFDFSETILPGNCDHRFTLVRTWRATDFAGNSTQFVQTINVNDNVAPTWTSALPTDVTVQCGEQVPPAVVTASDNCSGAVLIESNETLLPGAGPNDGTVLVRRWTAYDVCGNSTQHMQRVTINDVTPPVLGNLPPVKVNALCAEDVPPVANVTVSDNCSGTVDFDFSESILPGNCEHRFTINRIWRATDFAGNSTQFAQTIIVNDVIAPTWTSVLPADITVQCGESVPPVAAMTAIDNCSGQIITEFNETLQPGAGPNDGAVLTRTWTAYDVCGNSTQHMQRIAINDVTPPTLGNLPPAVVNVNCAANVPAVANITVSDNCQGTITFVMNETLLPGNCPNRFTLTRTWTATDFAGNSTQFVQTINVNDNVVPILTCPANATAQCTPDEVQVYDNLSEFTSAGGTASDNCGINGSLFGLLSQTQTNNVYIRTYQVTDLCGNTGTCTQTITVLDTQAPRFVNCPAPITVTNDVDKCGAHVVFSTPVANDNCGVVYVNQVDGLPSGSLFPVGSTVITFLASDLAGNVDICFFSITVVDMQLPNAVCQDVVVNLNAQGAASITPAQIGVNSSDNCPNWTLALSQTSFNCANVGNNSVRLTVTDASGNTAICFATVQVRDITPPTFTCPAPQTVNSCDGLVPNLVALVTNATDNCGVASITQNPVAGTDFGNAHGQSVIVTITATDVNGNTATCTVPVTINDNVPPTFVNCPTTMIMIGNDVDMCSGKLNWSIPVATDNCVLLSVVQIAGPPPGSVVPVGVPQTVVYRAFDSAGNSSTCAFQIQVTDTQKPEFNANILMPSNVTVECDAVPAPFVLTTADVNDNCTPSNLLVITFTQVRTDGNCPFNYTLTRTWRVIDQAGNQRVHTQVVTVRDTKAPTALCRNVTVTLDKNGNATVTPSQINNGSFDNCSSATNLTFSVTPSTFTCANLGANVVVLTVTDQCGNSATCTAVVTVLEGIGPCAPQYTVTTACLNNATTMDNGQFVDLITIRSLAMQTWTLQTNTGLFSNASPAPPAAPIALPVGTQFTAGHLDGIDNNGNGVVDEADEMIFYTLRGRHIEGVGYSITVQNNLGTTGTIANRAYYPTPVFLNLDGPFCLNTPPFEIKVGEAYGAAGTVKNIRVNGVPTNTFNAAGLGLGFFTVEATFDAGSATTNLIINGNLVGGTIDQALADPGCEQTISKVVQVVNTPTVITCNDLVHVSLGPDCVADIKPDDVLEGSYLCDDDYRVVLTYPAGTNTYNPPSRVDATHIGKIIPYKLVHSLSGNICWGHIKVEDKLAPKLTCPANITIACSQSTGVSVTGNVGIQDCSSTTTQIHDAVVNNGQCGNPRAVITRTFFVTDAWGNQAACTQTITVLPFNLANVQFPADITLNCDAIATDPSATAPSKAGSPTLGGASILGSPLCDVKVNFSDARFDGCGGTYTILRTWNILSDCLPLGPNNPRTHVQRIEVRDIGGPAFACPGNVTVSTDPFTCCATAPLPSVIVTEGCSGILDLQASVKGVDPATGNVVTFTVSGSLSNFPGNNPWHPDTMANFPSTSCLPLGVYEVVYTASDACGNTSSCKFQMTVADLVPPSVACIEFTQVALGISGQALVNASTFDKGSYDNCGTVTFKARRMFNSLCQDSALFRDQVRFCCEDIGDTITVVVRVYDVPVSSGNVTQEDFPSRYNECMVQVFVEDKLKPVCTPPANVTISCENFDPSLSKYGFAQGVDNCCVDTIVETRNLALFDTLCNRGTITRTFRVVDCGGNTQTCTQRIVVNYESDYFIRFPNDVVVTSCQGKFTAGEPTFFGKDCEALAVSFEDALNASIPPTPEACFLVERTWKIINWCQYNPNAGCVNVPNPQPNAVPTHPANRPGPVVSPAGTPAPWNPTVVAITPGATPTNYSTFWNPNANCYTYKQLIWVLDNQKPVITSCAPPDGCDVTDNDPLLWNAMYWWDAKTSSHDLCEAPVDLRITAVDSCSGDNLTVRYLLCLDLDGDGTQETVVSSPQTGLGGLGWNRVNYNNLNTPNYSGGVAREFDFRPVPANQKWGFAIQVTKAGGVVTAAVRWNTQQAQTTYVLPQLPHGKHRIKWVVEDMCGNEQVCEYEFEVKDCKKPTIICKNINVNIMPTKMIMISVGDVLQSTSDNCTPTPLLVTAIRKAGQGSGFPLLPNGQPQTTVTFTCSELGERSVEIWSRDVAGNADFCVAKVNVQDNMGNCSATTATVAGALKTEADKGLESAQVNLTGSSAGQASVSLSASSDKYGDYAIGGVPLNGDYTVTPLKDDDPLNGVSTYDLVLINRHILGIEPLNSPYKMIAADANNSRSITTFDIVELRKLILGIYTELPNNTSWRFVDKSFVFPDVENPFKTLFPETKQLAGLTGSAMGQDFVAVKVGDVNGNAITSSLTAVEDRTAGVLVFDVEDRVVKAGEVFTVRFRADELVEGYQFTLHFPNLEVIEVTPLSEGMTLGHFGVFAEESAVTTSFNSDAVRGEFAVTFRAKVSGELSRMLQVSSRITRAEAYSALAGRQAVALRFNGVEGSVVKGVGFEVYQNTPNPWVSRTQIGFHVPESTEVVLTVFDESGRVVWTQRGQFAKGYNAFSIDRSLLEVPGVLYYRVETPTDSAVRKMIQMK